MDLVAALQDPAAYPEATSKVELVQTHISWVFLTDRFAYKMKKPVDLGFVNFTTLRRRHHYLKQELTLNRRLCPTIYLAVLPIAEENSGIKVGGRGHPLEYILRMVRLPQERMMNEVADRGELTLEHLDRLVGVLAPFYQKAATGPHINHYGEPGVIIYNHEENFAPMKGQVGELLSRELFEDIRDFARGFLTHQRPLLRRRIREGRIRDCHGDLHMGNICLADDIYVFDCIEFNPRFRYGDVAADVAFLAMDLDFHGLAEFSRHFAERFVTATADEDLWQLLDFYKCYRACVRGKINAMTTGSPEVSPEVQRRARETARAYFALAGAYARRGAEWIASW
jgi:aminoglycoside phosphotransferase family enzyme|uniref:Aminoglycoside phosphotransferase domain-containing protein n=1 Tax=Desulfobacca acetoxidans TaxID=60893 RepID=A0A7V6A119_9BACT